MNRYRSATGAILCAALLSACSSAGTAPQLQPQLEPQANEAIPLATATPAPYHIPTWAYDDSATGTEGSTASASIVARYVTYAESVGTNKVLTDCHTVAPRCTAIRIVDASRIYTDNTTGILTASKETWWLHQRPYTDVTHRLRVNLNGKIAYVMNESNAAVQSYWQSYIRANYGSFDGLMLDDMSSSIQELVYQTQATSVTELTTDAQVLAMRQAFAAKMTHSNATPYYIIENGVSANPYNPEGLARIGTPANVHGLISEGVPVAYSVITSWYPNLLDLMTKINATPGFIVLLSYGTVLRTSDRYVHTATIWLGFSPGHEVSWEDLEGAPHLNVFPESTIYPTSPVQSMTTGNTNLLVQTKVWRREFRACYLRGALWGHCAALVNTNSVAEAIRSTWLTQAYTNQITVAGGDVQNSTATVSLGTKPASIPANSAVLLFGK